MAEDDFLAQITAWKKQVQKMATLSMKEQAQITKAGGDALVEEIHDKAKQSHYSKKSNPKWGHMADTVISQGKNVDGKVDGTSTVGWGDSLNAQKARWLNDGTRKMAGDHWLTNLRDSSQVQSKVFQAQEKEYKALLKKKGIDLK